MNAEESPEAGVAEEAQEDAGSALRLRVLQEIARVAAEKGRTPGCVSFRKETGLSAALWHGLIWARWSDAVREAGLVPNIKRGKLTDEQLLAGYAEAMRKHGRIPTDAELLLYRKSGSALPRHATYRSHFDSKGELLRRLREWCGETPAVQISRRCWRIPTPGRRSHASPERCICCARDHHTRSAAAKSR